MTPLVSNKTTLVAGIPETQGIAGRRSIEMVYDARERVVQVTQYGEETFATIEPIDAEEWAEITQRLDRAQPQVADPDRVIAHKAITEARGDAETLRNVALVDPTEVNALMWHAAEQRLARMEASPF